MKHPFSVAMVALLAVLGAFLVGLFLLKSHLVSIPRDWVSNEDSGNGVVDQDGEDEEEAGIQPMVSDSGNISVSSPVSGELIGLTLVIRGKARVFENTFNYRVLDAGGAVLAEGHAMTNAEDSGQFGDYTVTTTYSAPAADTGTVEVFNYSAKDGSVVDLVQVPVSFPKTVTMDVKAYWTTQGGADDCSLVAPSTHRVAKSPATAYAAMTELLQGPNTTDRANGFGTSIPEFVTLKSISIEGGVAKVEFNHAIEVGGSCRMQSIRAQIESTLKQFSTVTSVIITSEGRTAAESLQP